MGDFETMDTGGAASRLYATGDFTTGTPGVVLFHAWWGLNDDAVAYADRLAEAGFAVVAPDMFGGQVATTIDEATALPIVAAPLRRSPQSGFRSVRIGRCGVRRSATAS